MSEYDDKSYYEVQLEQKQLVLILLLLMAVCVLFFFLGVHYAKGREALRAGVGNGSKPAASPVAAPPGPDRMETEQVSRFFEKGGSKESAPKEEFEGGKVIAESLPTEPAPRADKKDKKKGGALQASPASSPKPPEPLESAPAREERTLPVASRSGAYVVQILALQDIDRANEIRNDLKSRGFPAYIEASDAGGDKLYKVRVGPYAARGDADTAKDGLRSQGYGGAFVSGE